MSGSMSGSMTWAGGDQLLMKAVAKRLYDPAAQLTAAEQMGIDKLFGTSGASATALPQAPGGDVQGWNSLCRTNWFNGRFLTAESLRRQDAYFDYRARLDAQALMPGVAHGLGIEADALNVAPYFTDGLRLTGGFLANRDITLTPGLAFDMIGRPILVPAAYKFRLEQLIGLQGKTPRRVVGGGTEFAPCVCLAPDPAGPAGGAPAIRPGPYLLVIEAAEKPSGEAKVYGEVCSGPQPVTCEGDAWCAGFGLSLVRFPVEVPESNEVQSVWDLRGVLSAYYFDVFEHSLITRWDPPFATGDGFCKATGPGRHDAGAVALAMVYLGTDGTALFVDPWIPRRSIVATPGEDWHRIRFGAPPRAAAWARIHQFQCMLSESLAQQPISKPGERLGVNLLRRGFRHIPPIGFLPIDPAASKAMTNPLQPNTGDATLDRILKLGGAQAGIVSGYVVAAREQARTYFDGTNVLAWCVVALHDDDILEDLANAFDKDPVQLEPAPTGVLPERLARLDAFRPTFGVRLGTTEHLQRLFATMLFLGHDDFVNRRVEWVKLVVPLQGLVRRHPVLGVVAEDAAGQAPDWGATSAPAMPDPTLGGVAGRLRLKAGLGMLPRHFVVYVKQRMVLLDALFEVIELLLVALNVVAQTRTAADRTAGNQAAGGQSPVPAAPSYVSTHDLRAAYQAQPAEKRAVAEAVLAHPAMRAVLTRALPLAAPEFAVADRSTAFQAMVETQDKALVATIPDAAERRRAAVDRTADSFAASHSGFEAVQLLAAVQPAAQTEALVLSIGDGARAAQALGVAPDRTAESEAVKDTPSFTTTEGARLYSELRHAAGNKPVTELVPGAAGSLTVREVLEKSPEEATALLGGAANYETFRTAYGRQAAQAAEAAERVVAAPPPGAMRALTTAIGKSGEDLAVAVKAAQTDVAKDGAAKDDAAKAYLDRMAVVVNTLGPERAAVMRRVLPAAVFAQVKRPA